MRNSGIENSVNSLYDELMTDKEIQDTFQVHIIYIYKLMCVSFEKKI